MRITPPTNIKYIAVIIGMLCLLPLIARAEQDCENQSLKIQGSKPTIITPGKSISVVMVSSKDKKESTLKLTSKKINNTIVVSGEIKNIGGCTISTFEPVKLYPIRNGLPLSWHNLPEGLATNPSLQAGEFLKFFKEYPKEYVDGFNLSIGSWNLSPSNKPAKADSNACSDKDIAKQLELIADQETKSASSICESAQAMNKVNTAALSVLDKCPSNTKDRQSLKKEIQLSMTESNLTIKQSCENSINQDNSSSLNNKSGSKMPILPASQCTDEALAARLDPIAKAEEKHATGICESARAEKRVYEKGLELLNQCPDSSENRKAMLKEMNNVIEDAKKRITWACG